MHNRARLNNAIVREIIRLLFLKQTWLQGQKSLLIENRVLAASEPILVIMLGSHTLGERLRDNGGVLVIQPLKRKKRYSGVNTNRHRSVIIREIGRSHQSSRFKNVARRNDRCLCHSRFPVKHEVFIKIDRLLFTILVSRDDSLRRDRNDLTRTFSSNSAKLLAI